jgi:pimeloyl-ACP methyl ester carboxylesterase
MVDRSSRIKLSAGQICWHEAGDSHRPVLIFLHGSWHDRRQWQQIVEPLSKNFHCFALDLLGFGNSIAIETPTSIAIEVDCLHEFLTALKLDQVYLIGHSLGAWIAINYTLKYPDLVRGVVTISPSGFSLAGLHNYGHLTKWLLAHPWLFRLWLNGLQVITSISDGANPLAKSQSHWSYLSKFPTTCKLFFGRSRQEISQELFADRLNNFRQPLFVIQSGADERKIIEESQACAQAVSKSEYKLIQESGLISRQELPIQIALEIQGFIDRVQTKIDREEVELW